MNKHLGHALFLTFLLFLDQSTKYFILNLLEFGGHINFLFFRFSLVTNTGISFGLFKGNNTLFAIISFLAILYFVYLIIISSDKTSLTIALAGIIGNFIDRITLGYVIDFIDFRIWPVFNLADVFIFCGIFLFVMKEVKKQYSAKKHGT